MGDEKWTSKQEANLYPIRPCQRSDPTIHTCQGKLQTSRLEFFSGFSETLSPFFKLPKTSLYILLELEIPVSLDYNVFAYYCPLKNYLLNSSYRPSTLQRMFLEGRSYAFLVFSGSWLGSQSSCEIQMNSGARKVSDCKAGK